MIYPNPKNRKDSMTRYITAALVAAVLAAGGFAVTAMGGNTPPGQDPCSHGATGKVCRPDPQPGHGKDCQHHGKRGGVNEDHCAGTTTGTTTTETGTTPSTSTSTVTTPSSTTTSVVTITQPGQTVTAETTPVDAPKPLPAPTTKKQAPKKFVNRKTHKSVTVIAHAKPKTTG